ncbi:MAG: DoxX family protein [Parvibaculaceae bacterium]
MFLSRWTPQLLSVLRIIAALLFFAHGSAKYLGFPKAEMFSSLSVMSPGGIAGIFELVGGALLAVGLFSRLTAFVLSGMMAVAYFMVHAPRDFHPILNGGELAIMFCFVFLYLAAAGPGPWSVDATRGRA